MKSAQLSPHLPALHQIATIGSSATFLSRGAWPSNRWHRVRGHTSTAGPAAFVPLPWWVADAGVGGVRLGRIEALLRSPPPVSVRGGHGPPRHSPANRDLPRSKNCLNPRGDLPTHGLDHLRAQPIATAIPGSSQRMFITWTRIIGRVVRQPPAEAVADPWRRILERGGAPRRTRGRGEIPGSARAPAPAGPCSRGWTRARPTLVRGAGVVVRRCATTPEAQPRRRRGVEPWRNPSRAFHHPAVGIGAMARRTVMGRPGGFVAGRPYQGRAEGEPAPSVPSPRPPPPPPFRGADLLHAALFVRRTFRSSSPASPRPLARQGPPREPAAGHPRRPTAGSVGCIRLSRIA